MLLISGKHKQIIFKKKRSQMGNKRKETTNRQKRSALYERHKDYTKIAEKLHKRGDNYDIQ
jgi:hypothetical protein